MTTRTVTVNVPFGAAATLQVGNVFETAKASLIAWNQARVTRKALANLSDAQLEDIGLTREYSF
ncbi:DUF1127 domain-containing protein [Cochlodiniinecator piscidefendens]|uniref:DUF1127 domain-containing protein n=1 Tax=Cochlodiniinecator piscidefendens TaxID=2715756 RepID=UPI0014098890|nr:DUF1127 domain-containing protein [Cochlodiniinecator piscidefendens]